MIESNFKKVPDRMGLSGRNDVVIRGLVLHHEVHGFGIVSGESPIAFAVEVSQSDLIPESELNPGDAVGYLPSDEFLSSDRTLMIEEDSVRAEHSIALLEIIGDPVRIQFRDRIGASRVEWSLFRLQSCIIAVSEHLRRGCLIELRIRSEQTDGVEKVQSSHRIDFRGEHGLIPRSSDEGLRSQIVDLIRLDRLDDIHERGFVGEISLHELDLISESEEIEILEARIGVSSDQSINLVASLKQCFREIGSILSEDSSDESFLHCVSVRGKRCQL